MARAVDSPFAYSFVYRVLSQSGAHPSPHGLDSLIENRPESDGVFIHGRPKEGPTIEPYYLAGALLFISLRETSTLVPSLPLTAELDASSRSSSRFATPLVRANGEEELSQSVRCGAGRTHHSPRLTLLLGQRKVNKRPRERPRRLELDWLKRCGFGRAAELPPARQQPLLILRSKVRILHGPPRRPNYLLTGA